MSATKAHALSLPLFLQVSRSSGKPLEVVLDDLRTVLDQLSLTEHIEPSVVPSGEGSRIELLPLTPKGKEVLQELEERSAFIPCPADSCEFVGEECRWCGSPKK